MRGTGFANPEFAAPNPNVASGKPTVLEGLIDTDATTSQTTIEALRAKAKK